MEDTNEYTAEFLKYEAQENKCKDSNVEPDTTNSLEFNAKQHRSELFENIIRLLNEFEEKSAIKGLHYRIENDIIGEITKLGIDAELFWREISWSKDILSYKFAGRYFPTIRGLETSITDAEPKKEIDVTKNAYKADKKAIDKPKTTHEEKLTHNRDRYDLRDMSTFIQNVFLDESNKDKKKDPFITLPRYKYCDTVRYDIIEYIFQQLYKHAFRASMLYLYCVICCSPDLCHFAFHEPILNYMFNQYLYTNISSDSSTPFLNPFSDPKYLSIIHKNLFYAWYTLYREETNIVARGLLNHRHVIDLEAMCKVPNFYGSVDQNPFIPLTLSPEFLFSENVPAKDYILRPIKTKPGDRGVYSIWSFIERFNIFTDNIFDGLDQEKVYFGGSVIAACLHRTPTEKIFGIDLKLEDDLLFNQRDEGPLLEEGKKRIKTYWANMYQKLSDYFDEYYPSKQVLPAEFYDINSEAFDALKLAMIEDILSDIDIMIDVVTDEEYDMAVYKLFNHICDNIKARNTAINDTNIYKYIQLRKILTNKSYKYYVSGVSLKRSIEIFRLSYYHPIGGASRFHFPAVRAVYHRGKVYGTVSCFSYSMTGYFTDYKWMTNTTKTEKAIINYFLRSGIMILNAKEHEGVANYIRSNTTKCSTVLDFPNVDKYIDINHPIFKPRSYGTMVYYDLQEFLQQWQTEKKINDKKSYLKHNNYHYVSVSAEQPKLEHTEKLSIYGFNESLRYISGHIRPVYIWSIFCYINSLKLSKKYI